MNIKYTLGLIIFFPLLPLMSFHGKKIKASVPKLPEATGSEGQCTIENASRKTLRMLAIGESTIAGVGVATHHEGFAGTLAAELSQLFDINVNWKVHARSGYTVKRVTRDILPEIIESNIDLIVVGIGGNDAFNLNSPEKWRKDVNELIIELKLMFPNTYIVFCNMPPIKEFPAFTALIKSTVGNLIELLGTELGDLLKGYDNIYYHNNVITLKGWNEKFGINGTTSDYFSDGVHPSKLAYQTWAKDIARAIANEYSFDSDSEMFVQPKSHHSNS